MRLPQAQLLFSLLQSNDLLKAKGFAPSFTQSGGIAIDRSGHVHGVWEFDGEHYTWRSLGSSEPTFRTDDPKSAVLYTLVALSRA